MAGMRLDIGGLGLDHEDVKALQDTIVRMHRQTGMAMKVAIRRATVALIKSLREKKDGTRESPKIVPRGNVTLSDENPKYITVGGQERRRVEVRKFGRSGGMKTHTFFVDKKTKTRMRRRNGVRVATTMLDKSGVLREARAKYGHIYNSGLARATWGWFMHALFGKVSGYADGGGGANGSRRVRIQRGRMVDGAVTERRGHSADGSISLDSPIVYTVDIVNRLSYIRKAMREGAIERALRKANNFLRGQLAHWDRIHGVN